MRERALVAGAGGFIGGHLVARLLSDGHPVRAVDIKPPEHWFQRHPDAENVQADLRHPAACAWVTIGQAHVYNVACDMGGMGFIAHHKAACMRSVLISTLLIEGAMHAGAGRYFYSSSACVYPAGRQDRPDPAPLREADAYPADPEDGYGWEKLFSERMCRHFTEDYGLETRVARYHNSYGPHGTWEGGREKAPAAICRKIAQAKLGGDREIDVWGDGQQTRSFMYVDDCVEGTVRLMGSEISEPVNVGSAETVTIDALVSLVAQIAGIRVSRQYDRDAPQGVRGRSSDNTLIRSALGWEPSIPLSDGLERTYAWVHDQVRASS